MREPSHRLICDAQMRPKPNFCIISDSILLTKQFKNSGKTNSYQSSATSYTRSNMADELVAEESYGEKSLRSQYIVSRRDGQLRKQRLYQQSGVTSISKFIRDAFLPQGYPHSVSNDYLEYQIWDTCQAFCSSIVAALAAQAMLKAYGVGDEKATVLAATLTWLLKDGAGMVGRIMFTWLKGTELDCHAKKWRLVADVINDLTYLIELLAPMFRQYFLLFACMSSICRSLVAVSGGATRAALTQHQARRDNMADVSAKDGSQETMVNLLAFLVNLILIPLVTGKDWIIWSLFLIFTSLHLYCNFRAVSAVVMETINSTRMHLLVENYISRGVILSPKDIAAIEPILLREKKCLNVSLGCEFHEVVSSSADIHAVTAASQLRHILKLQISKDFRTGSVHAVLHRNIDSVSLLQCYFQIAILDLIIRTPQLRTKDTGHNERSEFTLNNLSSLWKGLYEAKESPRAASWDMVNYAHKFTEAAFPEFLERLQARGWMTSRNHLGPDEWRADWTLDNGLNTEQLRNTRYTELKEL